MRTIAPIAGLLLGVASGCSSASSSSGTLAPGQIDADGPPRAQPPSAFAEPPPAPHPGSQGSFVGCPSSREPANATLGDVGEVRTRLAGIYRTCLGGAGLEIRIDPDTDTRLLWYALDDRFVRIEGAGSAGDIDIEQCAEASCWVTWHDERGHSDVRKLTVWIEPTAIRAESTAGHGEASGEWVRLAR